MGDTRNQILEAARDLVVADGLSAVTMRAVARRVGVSATAIYRHFEDKETLLAEVIRTGFVVFGQYLARGLAADTPRARMLATTMGYLDFGLEHPGYYAVMFSLPKEHFGWEKLSERIQKDADPTFQMNVDRVRECIDAGVFAPGDPVEGSIRVWAHCHGLVSLYHTSLRFHFDDADAFRAFYRASMEQLFRGLAPKEEADG